MKVALVALPWSVLHRPSAAVATLAAYLRQHEPSWEVRCSYEYVHVGPRLGVELYEFVAEAGHTLGEAAFIPCVHPDRREVAVPRLTTQLQGLVRDFVAMVGQPPWLPEPDDLAGLQRCVEHMIDVLAASLEDAARRVADCDVVGLTTCFGQLWANVAFCHALKRIAPHVVTVMGGSTVSSAVGPSILREYPFVDYVVQGEGEMPLRALVQAIERGDRAGAEALKGVVSQATAEGLAGGTELWELPDMNALPVPSYDEYVEQVDAEGMPLDWFIPLEGSRGCWWDRVGRTGNAKDTCYFCNLNLQWKGYREKTIARVASEMSTLSERYANTRVFFLDNIVRHKGVLELAAAVEANGRDFELFHEMRANVTPLEWVRLRDAGLEAVQVGIEGLSSSYLRRIGKGTTAIQNLQAMRYLRELDIAHFGNLIIDFPGATQAEVAETLDNVLEAAICYDPLSAVRFNLGRDSTVFSLAHEFPIKNVRNRDLFGDVLPVDVNQRLKLFDLSFDFAETPADWSSVRAFCDAFKRDRPTNILRKPYLSYRTGQSFVRIYDRRGQLAEIYRALGHGDRFVAGLPYGRTLVLRDERARLYTFCMWTRTVSEIVAAFPELGEAGVEEILAELSQERLIFREGKRVLALAVAENRAVARERVLAHAAEDEARAAQTPIARPTKKRGLPIVAPATDSRTPPGE